MRQAIVSIRDEDFAGSEEVISVFRDAELVDVETLSCDWTGGVVRVHVEEQLDENELDTADTVDWWEEVSHSGSGYVYLLEMSTTDASVAKAPPTAKVLPVGFIEIGDRGFTFDISGTQEGIRTVLEGFEEADIDVLLERIHEYRSRVNPFDSLTERQQEVLTVAYESGYYEVPRGTSTSEIAAKLGVDGSTVAEHLQRAERNLVSTIVDS